MQFKNLTNANIGLLLVVYLARISVGMVISITGPTLLTLADNIGVSVSDVSFLFTTTSIGGISGAFLAGFLQKKVHMIYMFAIFQFVLGGALVGIPFATTLWLLLILGSILGLAFGFMDAGCQALILQVLGQKKSRPHIAFYHFLIAVGGAVTPIIVRIFLNETVSSEDLCQNLKNTTANVTETTTHQYQQYTMEPPTTLASIYNSRPVINSYLVCGAYSAFGGLLFLVVGLTRIDKKAREESKDDAESRPEEPFLKVLPLLILVTLFYMFSVTLESLFTNYVYSVSVCSNLQLSISDAALLNTIFWVGYGTARFSLIFAFRFLSPKNIIIISATGTTGVLLLEIIWGENVEAIAWTVSFTFGFFVALQYPAGISWTSIHTNMSGRYIGIFSLGSSVGAMVSLPAAGVLYELNPFYTMYFIFSVSASVLLIFLLMVCIQKKLYAVEREGAIIEKESVKTQM